MNLVDVEPVRRADVALDEVHAQQRQWHRQNRRPAALTAREALAALQFESLLLWAAWHNVHNGVEMTDDDAARINVAMANINEICDEVGV